MSDYAIKCHAEKKQLLIITQDKVIDHKSYCIIQRTLAGNLHKKFMMTKLYTELML